MSRTAIGMAAAALLLGALAACGDDTTASGSGDSGGTHSSSGDFDVTKATLTDQRFCDQLDTTALGAVIGIPADKLRVTTDRTIGDKYEGPDEEQGLEISDVNMCILGSSTKQFIVTVQPTSSASRVQKTIDDLTAMKEGYGEVCQVQDDATFGDPGAVADCHGTRGSSRLMAATTGLVGDSKFYCAAILNFSSKGTDLQGPLVDTCHGILEDLAATT
jgi:hypothetical protein